MVPGKAHKPPSGMGPLPRNACRQTFQVDYGQGGLYSKQHIVSSNFDPFSKSDLSNSGFLCIPRKFKTSTICEPLATFSGHSNRCLKLSPPSISSHLCQSPLDSNCQMAPPVKGEPPPPLFNGLPLLGFSTMVAPINQAGLHKNKGPHNTTFSRDVHQLSKQINASAQMAPNLSFVIRSILEKQQVASETIASYLGKITSLDRYNHAFKQLWAILTLKNIDPIKASIQDVSSAIIQLTSISKPQARNAYTAMLYIPGFSNLRFCNILSPFKKDWSKGTPKYAHFWNPQALVRQLVDTPLMDDTNHLRTRLILCCRIFCLHRSIDLARVLRSLSFVDDKAFVLIKRKGWHCHQWEQMISIPDCPSISPLHLMIKYVNLTRLQCKLQRSPSFGT